MPNKDQNIGIRLDADLLAAVDVIADSRGPRQRSAVIAEAIKAYLGKASGGSVEQRLADVEQRLASVEQLLNKARTATAAGQAKTSPPPRPQDAPRQPRQNRQQVAPKPPQASQQPPGDGLTIGQALIAAGAEIAEAHALGSNRDQRMVTRYGMKAAPWLEAQGWQLRGRKWYPPGGQ